MLREHLFDKTAPSDPYFRWRGGLVSRLEGLSDGVFAFALTLLVVSLRVPQNFYEVWLTIRDFPAFAMSFLVLIMCWYNHYIFFRRFGLEDFMTMAINIGILFLVLFYVYPLKFLATFLWHQMIGVNVRPLFSIPANPAVAPLPGDQTFWLMIFYGLGGVGIFGLFLLLKIHAYRLRKVLELDEVELILARGAIFTDVAWVSIALMSVIVAFFSPPWSGLCYVLMGPVLGTIGFRYGTAAEKRYDEIEAKTKVEEKTKSSVKEGRDAFTNSDAKTEDQPSAPVPPPDKN